MANVIHFGREKSNLITVLNCLTIGLLLKESPEAITIVSSKHSGGEFADGMTIP